jgi:signal transduction histidine kinase/ActR/RegA family two-component response regulator
MTATAVVALLLTCATLIGYQYVTARADLERELGSLAGMIGATSSAALQFEDGVKANEILNRALAVDPRLLGGRLLTTRGEVLAGWERTGAGSSSPQAAMVVVRRPVSLDGETIGAIELVGDPAEAYARWEDYVTLVGALLAVSLGIAFLLSFRLQRIISWPILHLADQAQRVSAEGDYSLRVARRGDDEITVLYDRFNEMLSQIAERDGALREAHERLEERVRSRTLDLQREIAERERTQAQLIVARDAAESASRAKSAFLANMSHELRTPLNAIIGYSEMLLEDAEAAGHASAAADLGKIQKAGRHLLQLISDILDLSKIEVGKMTFDAETFPVASLVSDVVSTARPIVEKNGNRFEVSDVGALGTMVGDRTRLSQILFNLLSNAGKFTSNGQDRLDVSREGSPEGDTLAFRVADSGIGMTDEQIRHIFREFTQADSSTTRRFGGTGLGLAISRHLCRLMGGGIVVTSDAGRGSVFTATLPATLSRMPQTPPRPVAPVDAPAGRGPSRRKPVVLVVDDDADVRELAARHQARLDVEVVSAATAAEGVRLADHVRPDLILLDILLPDGDGWDVLRALKANPAVAAIPVVIVSVVDDRAQAVALGAAGVLSKPVSADRLREAIDRLCRRHPGAVESSPPPAGDPPRESARRGAA